MTGEAFRDGLTKNPFRPFLVKTTDGDTFRVDNRDFAIISPHQTEVIIYDKDNHYRVVALPQIVSLEPIKNGAKKPGKR
jgi:hypothetical protein